MEPHGVCPAGFVSSPAVSPIHPQFLSFRCRQRCHCTSHGNLLMDVGVLPAFGCNQSRRYEQPALCKAASWGRVFVSLGSVPGRGSAATAQVDVQRPQELARGSTKRSRGPTASLAACHTSTCSASWSAFRAVSSLRFHWGVKGCPAVVFMVICLNTGDTEHFGTCCSVTVCLRW